MALRIVVLHDNLFSYNVPLNFNNCHFDKICNYSQAWSQLGAALSSHLVESGHLHLQTSQTILLSVKTTSYYQLVCRWVPPPLLLPSVLNVSTGREHNNQQNTVSIVSIGACIIFPHCKLGPQSLPDPGKSKCWRPLSLIYLPRQTLVSIVWKPFFVYHLLLRRSEHWVGLMEAVMDTRPRQLHPNLII